MTNKEIQKRTEAIIKSLGSYDDWMKRGIKNPFPIGKRNAYYLARGNFDKCGKHGLIVMKDYFEKQDLNNKYD